MQGKSKASSSRVSPPRRRRRWLRILLVALGVPIVAGLALLIYYYVTFGRLIDATLHGERERVLPQVFARPLDIRRGQALSDLQLVDWLNDLGYAQRRGAAKPGEFDVAAGIVTIRPKGGSAPDKPVTVTFRKAPRKGPPPPPAIESVSVAGRPTPDAVTLEPPLLTSLISTSREKRRQVPLTSIPDVMVKAVLAIEDRRFFEHPGVDPIRIAGAIVRNLRRDKTYLEGASTITQQLVKNVFLAQVVTNPNAKSYRRKIAEQLMAVILEQRASKNEILELYLNEVYLGQRGSFGIHGVPEAARLFFGKDVANLTLAEAATIAGTIQSPPALSPFSSPTRSRDRRNVVLDQMAEEGFITRQAAEAARAEPLQVVARALEAEAPYFVDLVGQTLDSEFPGLTASATQVDVYTTLDLHYQRLAQDAVREGLSKVDELLKRRKRTRVAQAALIAADPRTGEIVALIGGRSYNQSQFNRAVTARRQPGSAFKPFVFLSAFERQANEGLPMLTPATLVGDEPTTFQFEDKTYAPGNYEDNYEGQVTLRRVLAKSLNAATVRVAERPATGSSPNLWSRIGVGLRPQAYPSIALGVFEATPLDVATAYTVFPNLGQVRPLRSILRIVRGGNDTMTPKERKVHRVARAGHDLPGHQHDAQRHQRGDRRRGARLRVPTGCGRQDRDDQRPARRLVRRLHARAADRRLGRLRRQHAHRALGRAGRAPHLAVVHDAGAGRSPGRLLRGPRRDLVGRDRSRHGQARRPRLPAGVHRVVFGRHRADRVVRPAQVLTLSGRGAPAGRPG